MESQKTSVELEWCNEYPVENGNYWFYGDPYMGQMGADYKPGCIPDVKLYYVKVRKMAVCDGQFMTKHKFNYDKQQKGWCGYWAIVIDPIVPMDIHKLFTPYGIETDD